MSEGNERSEDDHLGDAAVKEEERSDIEEEDKKDDLRTQLQECLEKVKQGCAFIPLRPADTLVDLDPDTKIAKPVQMLLSDRESDWNTCYTHKNDVTRLAILIKQFGHSGH